MRKRADAKRRYLGSASYQNELEVVMVKKVGG
jgi:hypothetical protein